MKAYGEAVQHLQELQPDAVIYLQAIMKVTTERSGQGDYILPTKESKPEMKKSQSWRMMRRYITWM